MPQSIDPFAKGDPAAELHAKIANTIGADVERAMDAVGWAHTEGTPQVPPVNPENQQAQDTSQTTPADNPPVASPTNVPKNVSPSVDWDQFKDANGMILGKYTDPNAAVKGMHSLLHMAKSALSERDALKAESDQLRRGLYQAPVTTPQPTQTPSAPVRNAKLEQVLAKAKKGEEINTDDLPLLIEGIEEQAELRARSMIQEQEMARNRVQNEWMNVDSYMAQNHPSSLNFAEEMTLFKRTHPEVGRVYDRLLAPGDEGAKLDATLYAWNEFTRANPHVLNPAPADVVNAEEKALQANNQVRKEEIDQARLDAGLLGSGAQGVHQIDPAQAGPSREEIDSMGRRMMQTGDGAAWRAATVGRDLNHPIFDNP